VQQYEALDGATKQAFNEEFLRNLEQVRLQPQPSVINSIFPPQVYGLADIDSLIDKYAKPLDKSAKSLEILAKQQPSECVPEESVEESVVEKPKRPMSPLLDKEERERQWKLGQSLDSKQVTSALGYLDLKQICYCLAHALMKHIEFAKGAAFTEDLGKDALDFSYALGDDLKIDIEAAKQKKAEKEE